MGKERTPAAADDEEHDDEEVEGDDLACA